MTSVAAQLATRHLTGVGTRLPHSATVASRARHAARTLSLRPEWIEHVASAGWLHDIGYAPEIVSCGFHPLDGARWLRARDVENEICSLVAWHTGSIFEAELRGLDTELRDEYASPPDDYLDVLTWADLTSAPEGGACSVRERIGEILARHGASSVVHQAVTRSGAALEAAATRVTSRLGSDYGELPHRPRP